jgi:hypothetical protein
MRKKRENKKEGCQLACLVRFAYYRSLIHVFDMNMPMASISPYKRLSLERVSFFSFAISKHFHATVLRKENLDVRLPFPRTGNALVPPLPYHLDIPFAFSSVVLFVGRLCLFCLFRIGGMCVYALMHACKALAGTSLTGKVTPKHTPFSSHPFALSF